VARHYLFHDYINCGLTKWNISTPRIIIRTAHVHVWNPVLCYVLLLLLNKSTNECKNLAQYFIILFIQFCFFFWIGYIHTHTKTIKICLIILSLVDIIIFFTDHTKKSKEQEIMGWYDEEGYKHSLPDTEKSKANRIESESTEDTH
jgi:hypothetical protein